MKTLILAALFFAAGFYIGLNKAPILAQWKPATPAPVVERQVPTPRVWTPTRTALDERPKSTRN